MGKTSHSELVYEFGPFRLDTGGRILRRGGQTVALAPKAYETLLVLVRDGGRVVSKQELMDAVWPDTYVEESSLTTNIFVIRKALSESNGAPDDQSYIETLSKRGYRLTLPVRVGESRGEDEQESVPPPIVAPAREPIPANGDGATLPAAFDDSQRRADDGATTPAPALAATNDAADDVARESAAARAEGGGRRHRRRAWLLWALPAVVILAVGSGLGWRWNGARQLDADRGGRQQQLLRQSAPPEGARAEARRLYLTGRYFWNKRDDDYAAKSIALYKRALELDPTFAAPYSGIADVYAFDHYQSGHWRESEELAQKAIAVDPSRGEAHASLGFVRMFHHWDWAAAEREFRTAIELDPAYATAHHWYAVLLEVAGRYDEAKAEIKRAAELDPTSLPINADLAEIHNAARDYKQAEEYARAALELDPKFSGALQQLQRARAGQGVFDEGAPRGGRNTNACVEASPASPWNVRDGFRMAGCERALRELLADALKKYDPPRAAYGLAKMHASLGDNEAALARLEDAHRHHNFFLVFIKSETAFDGLRAHPRFRELLRRMNLPAD